jgi:hypothetical protein
MSANVSINSYPLATRWPGCGFSIVYLKYSVKCQLGHHSSIKGRAIGDPAKTIAFMG